MRKYANYVQRDPFRRGLHYPAVAEALGDVNKKRILDVGCGDGLFPRLLAKRGASVVGYDKAIEKIAEAQAHRDAPGLDISYGVAVCRVHCRAHSILPLHISAPCAWRKIRLSDP